MALCAAAAVLALSPIVAFLAYDVLAFQPNRADLQAILASADPDDREPPPLLRKYVHALHPAGEGSAQPAEIIVRPLLARLGMADDLHGLTRLATYVAWEHLLSLHLSDDEIFGLYCTLSYNGEGHGVNALSRRLFGKPSSALSAEEAATVVAALPNPSSLLRDPQRLQHRRDALLVAAARVADEAD